MIMNKFGDKVLNLYKVIIYQNIFGRTVHWQGEGNFISLKITLRIKHLKLEKI